MELIFPVDQLHYCFFEDLAQRPTKFLSDILLFLGVASHDPSALLPAHAINVAARGKAIPVEFERELAKDFLPSVVELCGRFETVHRRYGVNGMRHLFAESAQSCAIAGPSPSLLLIALSKSAPSCHFCARSGSGPACA